MTKSSLEKNGKIFIVGLPRTGTTSLCAAFLDHGFRVAHTAYSIQSVERAQVCADTPIYCDYPLLDTYFSHSKFIHLTRDVDAWAESMLSLIAKVSNKIQGKGKGYHPLLERCFEEVFRLNQSCDDKLREIARLRDCYRSHYDQVESYARSRQSQFLSLDISHPDAYKKLCLFIGLKQKHKTFPKLNCNGRVFDWERIKHPLKIGSHERGVQGRRYFDVDIDRAGASHR